MKEFQLVKFEDKDFALDVRADLDNETVWLTQDEMSELFDRDRTVIGRHIRNSINEECNDNSVSAKFAHTANDGKTYMVDYYNLDVIISVGYRVKSQRGIIFRRWANKVLKDYLVKGYAANTKQLEKLNKVIEVQNRMLAYSLDMDAEVLTSVINEYTKALDLLDDYDHQTLQKPKGAKADYVLTYKEAREIINLMKFSERSSVFGVEKEEGKLEGILGQIYQNVFGKELYPTVEEKAAHLLYFLVKDHPFADGCKRIAATLFIQFLYRNNALYKNNKQVISNEALVAITILTAESNPNEMEIIVKLIMNLL